MKIIKNNDIEKSINLKRKGNLLFMSDAVLNGEIATRKTELKSFGYLLINYLFILNIIY